jgi:L-cysteate sulfo-lyase
MALWVKRDDLTPLAGGGNKVRKLDHLCAAAIAAGADVLVTGGGAQSNHVRLTAAAGRRLGLEAPVAGSSPVCPTCQACRPARARFNIHGGH